MTNRGRFQAQGDNTEKSEPWATDATVFKLDGNSMINNLRNQLTPNELVLRNAAIQKARAFVNSCPIDGIPPLKKSYSNNIQNRAVRIDIEVHAGVAFVTP